MYKFDKFVQERMAVVNERVVLAVLEKPTYYDGRYYANGMLKVGSQYLPLEVEANDRYIHIRAEPFYWTLTWTELEKW